MASDAQIRNGISLTVQAFKAANDVETRLSVAGDLFGLPYPPRPTRMQKAVYAFARVADWLNDITIKLPTMEAASCIGDDVLMAVDRFVAVRRVHSDPSIFAPELSATSHAIPYVMAANCVGSQLRRFAFDLVGESAESLWNCQQLSVVADKLLNLESGEKYSYADELDRFIDLQRSEAELWCRNYSMIESALRRELYEAESVFGELIDTGVPSLSSKNAEPIAQEDDEWVLIISVDDFKKGRKTVGKYCVDPQNKFLKRVSVGKESAKRPTYEYSVRRSKLDHFIKPAELGKYVERPT